MLPLLLNPLRLFRFLLRLLRLPMAALLLLLTLFITVLPAAPVLANAAVIPLINNQRVNAGLQPLTVDARLDVAALRHSNDMAAGQFLDHVGSDGSRVGDRVLDAGYQYSAIGENILFRSDNDAGGAFSQWWNSTPHRANMMSPSFAHVGIASVQSGSGQWYFTLVLAAPPGYAPPPTSPQQDLFLYGIGLEPALMDGRLNADSAGAPTVIYCTVSPRGFEIWRVNLSSQGMRIFTVTAQQAANGLATARTSGVHVELARSGDISLWALTSNELQLQGNDLRDPSKKYNFVFDSGACGPLPSGTAGPLPAAETAETPATTTAFTASPVVVAAQTGGVHIVQPGENLFRIALRYGVRLADLAAANGITNPARIFAGQRLVIPGGTVAAAPVTTTTTTTTTTASGSTYTVQPGDNLFRIALRFGVNMNELAALNGIADVTRIFVGQVLQIPE